MILKQSNYHNKIVCLMGPTAVGKTAVAMDLIKKSPFEIISVDSGMIYRGLDVGTAKPNYDELKVAPHRLINICDPAESYSVGQFRLDAIAEIEKIFASGKIPLLVGGTMLYFKVLQQGISELPQADQEIRKKIAQECDEFGLDELYRKLQDIDPESASGIKSADKQRICRALEVFEITGKTLSELKNISPPEKLPYEIINIGLVPDKLSDLHNNIDLRFKEMLRLGFIEEVEKLYQREDLNSDMPSIRMVGYRQVWQYLSGEISYEELLVRVPIVTRQLAKRQLTWLRSWPEIEFCTKEKLLINIRDNSYE